MQTTVPASMWGKDQMIGFDYQQPQQSSRPSLKRPLQDHENTADQKRPCISRRPHVTYKRQPKPPYTYLAMTVVAIHNSPSKRLTLHGIHNALEEMFTFFQGEYRGWRASVRHNLSVQRCFIRIPRNDDKSSKGSFWTVDLSLVPNTAFERTTNKNVDHWAPNLFIQLDIPEISIPLKHEEQQQTTQQKPLRPRPSFSIDSILGSADRPVSVRDHPYSFLAYQNTSLLTDAHSYKPNYQPSFDAMVYQAVNTPFQSHLEASLCPVPSYGEAGPLSYLTTHHQMLPDYTYNSAATDLSLPDRDEPTPVSSSDNWNLASNSRQNGDVQQTTGGDSTYHNQIPSHSSTSQNQVTAQLEPTPTFYRPFEDEDFRSFRPRPPSSISTISSTTSSSAAYSSDTSSVIFQPQSSSQMYIPSSFNPYSSDSSDACMEPPSLPASNSYAYSTSAFLAAAVDDLVLFSGDNTSSSGPHIPIPVFSDDSTSSSTQPDIQRNHTLSPDFDIVSTSSSDDVINLRTDTLWRQ